MQDMDLLKTLRNSVSASVEALGAGIGYKRRSGALSIITLTLERGASIEVLAVMRGTPEFEVK